MPGFGLPLAVWQFASPGMLLWGLAAVVPLVIHLFSRATCRQEPWAAMAFLLAALQKSARRLRLQQWLLLAVRIAIIALFAAALADPQLTGRGAWTDVVLGEPVYTVLALDGSYSMDCRHDVESRWEAAKEIARQLIERSNPGDSFSLVLMGQPPRL